MQSNEYIVFARAKVRAENREEAESHLHLVVAHGKLIDEQCIEEYTGDFSHRQVVTFSIERVPTP